MKGNNPLIRQMISYYANDPKRIQHFLKVYQFAKFIGEEEGLDDNTQYILETAALVHDIGIKKAELVYGNCSGKHQEELGPKEAENMLKKLGYESQVVERVCYLVGHHHTYTNVEGMDYQILIEADFLVNLYEDHVETEGCQKALDTIFRTRTGKGLLEEMFL